MTAASALNTLNNIGRINNTVSLWFMGLFVLIGIVGGLVLLVRWARREPGARQRYGATGGVVLSCTALLGLIAYIQYRLLQSTSPVARGMRQLSGLSMFMPSFDGPRNWNF
jgi:hypothetical protein